MENVSGTEGIRRLASGKCVPCNDAKPFSAGEASERLKDLPGWVLESGTIQKEFRFKSYLAGLDFAYSLGKIAGAGESSSGPVRWVASRQGGIVNACD
jgi:hypothetical protein